MTKFEDVKDLSTEEYFNNNQFSIDAFKKKYTLYPDETYVKSLKRVCDYIASVEKTNEQRKYWSERWFDEIFNDWWHPAGSIMQGAGSNRKISLCNCTTISLGVGSDDDWDNLESIIKNTAYTVAKSAAYRQGLGVDFSRLRPRGTKVLNSSNESTGSIHWMKFIDSIGYYVGQKGRIPAMLFSLSIKHPDVEEFITIKSDYTKLQNANISVQCTDDFYKAVNDNKNWVLEFKVPAIKKGQKVYVDVHSIDKDCQRDDIGWYYIATHNKQEERIIKEIPANKLLELIAKNMCMNAEPGIQNIDIARKYSNSDYVYDSDDEYDSRIISTNACSEQMLSRESLCVLSSINCEKFSIKPEGYEKELENIGKSINRFLDNVNECELVYKTYATPHQKMAIEKLRRTGAGYTNLAAWLFKQNLEYGSDDANKKIAKFTERFNYYLYLSSIEIGKEKGSFGLFKKEKFVKSPFVKRMIELGLEFNTMRNCTCSSIAPTGSLSLLFRDSIMSYGIEPAFGMYYWKRTRISGKYDYYFCVLSIVRKIFKDSGCELPIKSDTIKDTWDGKFGKKIAAIIEENKDRLGIKFKCSVQILPSEKLNLMAGIMKWIDSSISVTYLLPENSDWKQVYDFILEAHRKEVKSVAAFPDKKMYGIVSFIPFKDLAIKLKADGIKLHPQNFSTEELLEINLANEDIQLKTSRAPKRLKSLDAEIFVVNVKSEKFVIVVGIQNGIPYEVFGGHANGFKIKTHKSGKLIKISRGKYSLEYDGIVIEDFSTHFTPVEKILFRLISTMLRHGVPIVFIVEQLAKATDDITSLSAALCRVLKQYIKDGQLVSGQSCPSCGLASLVYRDGCVSCSCGYEKCL